MSRRLQPNQVESGNVVRAGKRDVEAGTHVGGSRTDRGPDGWVAAGIVQIPRRVDFAILMVGRAATQSAAAHHDTAVVQ